MDRDGAGNRLTHIFRAPDPSAGVGGDTPGFHGGDGDEPCSREEGCRLWMLRGRFRAFGLLVVSGPESSIAWVGGNGGDTCPKQWSSVAVTANFYDRDRGSNGCNLGSDSLSSLAHGLALFTSQRPELEAWPAKTRPRGVVVRAPVNW